MTDIDIGYSLDNAGYMAGMAQIEQANARVQQSIGSVTTTSTGLSRALAMVTPGRATIAGMTLLAQQAAQAQASLQNLSATSTVTGTNVGKLAGGMRQMARDMPIGGTASRQIVEQFTKMGLGAAGSEQKILKLSTTVAKLSGATGEGPAQLAEGMTALARATGNTNLDPKRFQNLGDSLTTVAAKGGASATSILAFSKSIAPMAQASGIGATGVLGISTAFSRLGEDGLGASTAVNKMLSDMNRAVREGSPEMKTYAQMAGKTTDEFERLFKLNPAEALTQVTEAVAKAGPSGPRMLEQIGIEGVRGQRSLQALSASGGLRAQIATATAAYGSGSTEAASKEAFGGLNDSMTRLGESTEQVAEALGAPLLGPLTLFTDGLNKATGGLAKLLSSGPMQTIMKGGVIAGVGALAAKSVVAPIGALALGRQLATSGPVTAAILGALQGGGNYDPNSRLGRFTAGAARAEAAVDPRTGKTRLRSGAAGGLSGMAMDIAYGYMDDRSYRKGTGRYAPGGDSPEGQQRERRATAAQRAKTYSNEAVQSYLNMTRQQIENSTLPVGERKSSWGFSERVNKSWDAAKGANDSGTMRNATEAATNSLKAFDTTMLDANTTLKSSSKDTVNSLGGVAKASAGLAAQLGKDAASLVDSMGEGGSGGLKSMAKGGLITAAITAVTTLLTKASDEAGKTSSAREKFLEGDISETINAYRESIGKATDTTATFGSTSEALNKQLVLNAKQMTFEDVKRVTTEDKASADATKDKVTNTYKGDAKEIAAQIVAMEPQGVTTDELQAIKTDLLRQMPEADVTSILKLLPSTFESGKGPQGVGTAEMNKAVDALVGASGKGGTTAFGNFFGQMIGGTSPMGGNVTQMEDLDTSSKYPSWLRTITGSKGGGLDVSTMPEEQQKQLKVMQEGIAQTFAENEKKFGTDYAVQERTKQADAALAKAVKDGNAEAFMMISNEYGQVMAGEDQRDSVWSPKEFEEAGGHIDKVFAKYDKDYGKELAAYEKRAEEAGGSFKPELLEQAYTKAVRGQSEFLGKIFDVREKGPASQAMAASMNAPEKVDLFVKAINEATQAAINTHKPLDDLAVEAAKAAGALPEGSPEQQRAAAIGERATFLQGAQNVFSGATPGQVSNQQAIAAAKMAAIPVVNETTRQQQQQGEQQTVAMDQANRQRAAQRLGMERQRFIAQGRMQDDFDRQQLYSKKDYELQVFRMERNFGIQRERQLESFAISQARAEEDFATNRARTLRDFATAALRAEQDYQKARARQIRDFNISLKRQIEDAAKSMYDPYERIQTKATWDTQNLLVNMAEQTEAMKKQKDQLDKLREMGLSAQTIDILGLGKTENAQQLNNIMGDASPENIAALNAAAKQRAEAAGTLFTDSSNTDLKRSREDLNKSLADQEKDYLESVKRSQEDLRKSLRDSERDFARAMKRSADDLKRNLRNAQDDLHLALKDMATDRDTAMARAEEQLGIQLSRMAEDIKEADMIISADMETLAEETNKAIHGKTVHWTKLMKDDTKLWLTGWNNDVIPQVKTAYAAMGINAKDVAAASTSGAPGSSTAGHSDGSYGSSSHGGGGGLAEGGPVPGWSPHPKADNVKINATAGEFMQPVKAVNHYGADFMEAVRTLRFPKEQALAEGGMVYKQMETWLHKNLPGVAVTSSYRPGAITALGNVSMHAQGKALDLAPSMSTFNKILGSFGKKIHQLFYSPADGRTILRGNPWRMDGVTKGDHWDHVHWAMQSMEGLAGAAGMGGMSPETLAKIIKAMPRGGPIQKAISDRVAIAFTRKMEAIARAGGGTSGGPDYKGEDATARWSPNVKNVLRMLGQPLSNEGAVLRRIDFESDGNPNAINNWDSNAKNGTPSKGLMQVIDPTFKAYRGRSLPNNIWDPTANIYAGSNYAIKRYGSLSAIDPKNRPKGYDDGGKMPPGEGGYNNGTGKPEAVLTHGQWDHIAKLAEYVGRMVSADDMRGVNAARGAHIVVHNNQHYVYDSRNDFEGANITVEAQDPDEMARKLEAKAVTKRITQTRGVRR